MNRSNEDIFDELIKNSLNKHLEEGLADIPSDEELKKLYPVPKKFIRQTLRNVKAKKYHRPIALVYLQRVGVVVLAVAMFAFGFFVSDDQIEANESKASVRWTKAYFGINFIQNEPLEEDIIDISALKIGYIPEGFELINIIEDSVFRGYVYKNENDECISISINTVKGMHSIDNEDVDIKIMKINDYEAWLITATDSVYTTLAMGNSYFEINISGALEKEEIIRIAKNIK